MSIATAPCRWRRPDGAAGLVADHEWSFGATDVSRFPGQKTGECLHPNAGVADSIVVTPSSIRPSPEPSPPARADLEHLVREHQAMVWRYLRFLGCRPAEADDLTQDTFLAVLDTPVSRFGTGGARAYLRRVARNAFLKHVQRTERRLEVDLEAAEAAYEWYRGDDEGQRTGRALDECLATLPAPARHALALRFSGRGDRDALAAQLGIGAHGVKSLLQRSYAQLRACIARRLRHERDE